MRGVENVKLTDRVKGTMTNRKSCINFRIDFCERKLISFYVTLLPQILEWPAQKI